jgi:stearoyl-CoA desaturase (Delta-9 desaturase)
MLRVILLGLLIGFGVSFIAFEASTVFLHRGLSHRAVTFRRPVTEVFRFVVWISTGIRPRQWVAVHRKHHAFTDIEGDPHSPVLLGWPRVQMMNVALYRREANNPATVARYARDLPATRADRVLYDHALLGLAIGITLLVVVFGPAIGFLAAFIHLNLYLGGSAAVNAIAHRFGRHPYPNGAGNLQLLALITAGEGLHNNHHAAPTSARLSHRWFEIDPGWWMIRVLMLLRLAKVRLTELRFVSAKKAPA